MREQWCSECAGAGGDPGLAAPCPPAPPRSTMDSVITQVQRKEEDGEVVTGDGEAGGGVQSNGDEGGGGPGPAPDPAPDTNNTIPAKSRKKKHKLFHSLLCCFGVRRRSKAGLAGAGQTDSSPDPGQFQPEHRALLPDLHPADVNKKCLVIDLDETLVHSSFKPISNADFIVPVEIDGTIHQVYVLKRPYVDEFLKKVGELYECVLFTASLAKYADPVTDLLDKWDVFRARLFRESCVFHRGNYVKDLGRLGRTLDHIIILDNSPASYIFHPENAVPCTSWFDDMENKELLEFIPFFEELSKADNIYTMLRSVQRSEGPPPPLSGLQQQRV